MPQRYCGDGPLPEAPPADPRRQASAPVARLAQLRVAQGERGRELDGYADERGGESRAFGVPYPGTFVVDAKRSVTSRYFEERYQERNTSASIIVRKRI